MKNEAWMTFDQFAAPFSMAAYHAGRDVDSPSLVNQMSSYVMQRAYPITNRGRKIEYLGDYDRYYDAVDQETGKRVIKP